MDFSDALRGILDGDAVLFLGTGFSRGAIGLSGDELLTPSQLTDLLYEEVGIPSEDRNQDLAQAADIYQEEKGEYALVDLLRNLYTVSTITDDQAFMGSRKWRRIYTTNYDSVIERAFEQKRRRLPSAVLSQKPSLFDNKEGMCIHLNGSITSLEPSKLGTEFKLTDKSYLEDSFLSNEWMSFFRSDLRTAKVVLFVGYSMKYDLDLKRIIFSTSGISEKTFFIVAPQEKELNMRSMRKYGNVQPIGLNGLVEQLRELEKSYHPVVTLSPILFSFNQIEIPTSPSPIKDRDVFKLFIDGDYDRGKIYYSMASPSDYPYYLYRDKIASVFKSIQEGNRNILIHSDLGNGKTLFLAGLESLLADNGFRVFVYRRYEVSMEREVEKICSSHEKTVIVVDGYGDKFNILKTISRCRTDQTIVLSERSAIFDITFEDIERLFGEFLVTDVNKLSKSELTIVNNILMRNGLWGAYSAKRDDERLYHLSFDCHSQFREIVLNLLDSPDIKRRFEAILSSVKKKEGFYEAIIFILICQVCNVDLDLEQLAAGLNISKLNSPAFRQDVTVREFVDFDREIIRPKSSLVAEKLLQSIVDTELVVDVVISIVGKLDTYSCRYEVSGILLKLIDYTHIQKFLNKSDPGYSSNLLRYYESLKTINFCRENPDFWLQYAIVKISQTDFKQAKVYFDTAYAFAKKKGQNPYRIDNHYARYLLEEQIKFGKQETCIIVFREAHGLLIDEKRGRQNLYYPYRVARNYYPYYQRFYPNMNADEKQYFLACCRQMLDRIERYISETNTGSISRDVLFAKDDLLKILS